MPRQIGLKDIHIAIVTSDDSTETVYATPVKLERAISAKISPKSNSDNIYSDEDSIAMDATIISSWFTTVPDEPTVV